MRKGGEQPETNDQSVTKVNSIRPDDTASQLGNGEARKEPRTLRGNVIKRCVGSWGGWRWNERKVVYRNQGGPFVEVRQMEVRAFIVAKKSRNGDGAKGTQGGGWCVQA